MPRITIFLGIILIVMGVAGYIAAHAASITALIPAFFGVAFVLLGYFSTTEKLRKHLMHLALILALLAIAGSAGGVSPFISYLGGEEIDQPLAAGVRSAMTLLCIIYTLLGIKSFIDARKQQQAS